LADGDGERVTHGASPSRGRALIVKEFACGLRVRSAAPDSHCLADSAICAASGRLERLPPRPVQFAPASGERVHDPSRCFPGCRFRAACRRPPTCPVPDARAGDGARGVVPMTPPYPLREQWFGNVRRDILSGVLVALALIPEAIAFSIIAGVDPRVGLYASFCIAVVTAIAGGRPGMISAATGAMALVMVDLVRDHGLQYLLAATILAGALQILA